MVVVVRVVVVVVDVVVAAVAVIGVWSGLVWSGLLWSTLVVCACLSVCMCVRRCVCVAWLSSRSSFSLLSLSLLLVIALIGWSCVAGHSSELRIVPSLVSPSRYRSRFSGMIGRVLPRVRVLQRNRIEPVVVVGVVC